MPEAGYATEFLPKVFKDGVEFKSPVVHAPIADAQVRAAALTCYVFTVGDVATGDIDIVVEDKVEVVDVVCQKLNGAGAGNTMQIQDGTGTAISDAIACATDTDVTRAATIDDSKSVLDAGATLRLHHVKAAGTGNARVIVHVLRR